MHLQEVEHIVAKIQALSLAERVSFGSELDGNFVGAIDSAQLDRSRREGLIGAWRRHLDELAQS